jgi:hypothetical protein
MAGTLGDRKPQDPVNGVVARIKTSSGEPQWTDLRIRQLVTGYTIQWIADSGVTW